MKNFKKSQCPLIWSDSECNLLIFLRKQSRKIRVAIWKHVLDEFLEEKNCLNFCIWVNNFLYNLLTLKLLFVKLTLSCLVVKNSGATQCHSKPRPSKKKRIIFPFSRLAPGQLENRLAEVNSARQRTRSIRGWFSPKSTGRPRAGSGRRLNCNLRRRKIRHRRALAYFQEGNFAVGKVCGECVTFRGDVWWLAFEKWTGSFGWETRYEFRGRRWCYLRRVRCEKSSMSRYEHYIMSAFHSNDRQNCCSINIDSIPLDNCCLHNTQLLLHWIPFGLPGNFIITTERMRNYA